MNGMTLSQKFHAFFNHDSRHRWYAWYPIKIHNYCGGLPTGHEPKVVCYQWVEREWDLEWKFWRYYEIEDETQEANKTELS